MTQALSGLSASRPSQGWHPPRATGTPTVPQAAQPLLPATTCPQGNVQAPRQDRLGSFALSSPPPPVLCTSGHPEAPTPVTHPHRAGGGGRGGCPSPTDMPTRLLMGPRGAFREGNSSRWSSTVRGANRTWRCGHVPSSSLTEGASVCTFLPSTATAPDGRGGRAPSAKICRERRHVSGGGVPP